jgi:hypothetical protein
LHYDYTLGFLEKAAKQGRTMLFLSLAGYAFRPNKQQLAHSNQSKVIWHSSHHICDPGYVSLRQTVDSELISTGSMHYGYDRHVFDVPVRKYSHAAFVSFISNIIPYEKLIIIQDWLAM